MALKQNGEATIDEVKAFYEAFVSHLKKDLLGKNGRLIEIQKFIDETLSGTMYYTALDIGCGIGITTEHLRNHIPNTYGIDISEANISVARQKGQAEYYSGDFLTTELGWYNVICMFDVVEHIIPSVREQFLLKAKNSATDLVLVSIPDPVKLQWYRDNNPKVLQIVDEPVYDSDFSMFNIIEKRKVGIYYHYILEP